MQTLDVKSYWDTFWENRAIPGSQNDRLFQELSIQAIIRLLKPDDIALNVGCGDGYGFDEYCSIVKKITGMDYSVEAIDKANEIHSDLIDVGKAEFIVGNLLEIQPELLEKFDVVISERCLCNLDTEEKQKNALLIIAKYLKPKGLALICEPSLQGYDAIDKIRQRLELEPIKRHWHNVLLNEDMLTELEPFIIQERYTFGVYTLLSRLFYPLYIHPQEPQFDNDINKIASILCREIMTEPQYKNIPSQHTLYILRRVD